jgi:methyl-accepting chemotaxis protein
MIGGVSQAMADQSSAAAQIAAAAADMRRQSDQLCRGLAEQARAAADISSATQGVARQIVLITRANREQTAGAGEVLGSLRELRRIASENHAHVDASTELAERIRLLGRSDAGR